MTPPQNLVIFGSFLGGDPKFCLEQSCSPWIWTKLFRHGDAKVGRKGTATRWGCRILQNWLQEPIKGTWQSIWASSFTDLRQLCLPHLALKLPFGGGFWTQTSPKYPPPNIWRRNLIFFTEISSFPKISPSPLQNFVLHRFPINRPRME